MRVSDKALVLQSIRHGENKVVLRLYTSSHGLLTVICALGKKATSRVRAGSIMALNFLEIEIILKENKELHQLTEATAYFSNSNISGSFSKISIAQFLNELLLKCLKEQSPNAGLFEFIENVFRFLNDSDEDYMNVHLYFLSELTKYLGFEPQNNFSKEERYFDCREGRFTPLALAFPLGLNETESRLFSEFLKINSLRTRITNEQRQNILEIFLAYYKMHIPAFNELKSLEVLREITRA